MEKKQLILLRHAKSDWFSGAASDFDRPLNDRGRRDAPRVGRWLARHGYRPQRIICSSAARTRETLEQVAGAADWEEVAVRYEDRLYLAPEEVILDIARMHLGECSSVMLVGHNPGIEEALSELCPDIRPGADGKLMTTAAFAVIEGHGAGLERPLAWEFRRAREL